MNDAIAAHGSPFQPKSIAPILTIDHSAVSLCDSVLRFTVGIPADLPPPIASPTLVRLHCALTT